jgi:hypothetical protein
LEGIEELEGLEGFEEFKSLRRSRVQGLQVSGLKACLLQAGVEVLAGLINLKFLCHKIRC